MHIKAGKRAVVSGVSQSSSGSWSTGKERKSNRGVSKKYSLIHCKFQTT